MKKPFTTKSRSIRTTLKGQAATITREVQSGVLAFGSRYVKASWWVKYDTSACAMGPFSKRQIRLAFAA
jgi:hypothetical protein